MIATLRAGAGWCAGLAVGFGLWASAGTARAQSCATCEGGGAGGAVREKTCGPCGLRQYPFSDKRYIRQFCHPTICPGSCFGYFKTQWTPWGQACPNWCGDDSAGVVGYGVPAGQPVLPPNLPPSYQPGPSSIPPSKAETPMPPAGTTGGSPLPAPKEVKPATPPAGSPKEPGKDTGKGQSQAPTPPAAEPQTIPVKAPGLILPPVPDLPIGIPAQPPTQPQPSPAKF